MRNRMIAVYCIFVVLFSLLFLRTGSLSSGEELAETAQRQTAYTLTVETTRGTIYDTKMRPLTQNGAGYAAAILPTAENSERVLKDPRFLTDNEVLRGKLEAGYPFLAQSKAVITNIPQVTTIAVENRVASGVASHIIGYTNVSGEGMTGIEKVFDAHLRAIGSKTSITYAVDALRRPLIGAEPEIRYAQEPAAGVVLTIDRRLQEICEEISAKYLEKGAIVLMEAKTGKIRACASFPDYDTNDLTAALADTEGAPLVNRAFSAYNLGSVFKTVIAAAALTDGADPAELYECTGQVQVGDTVFRCAHRSGQGALDLNEAMAQSCNPYFITQGIPIDPRRLYAIAADLSFGSRTELAPGMISASGSLPTIEDLCLKGECANFCFGQGKLTATPIQVAQMLSGIVNEGCVMQASLVEGYTNNGVFLSEAAETTPPVRAISPEVADRVQEALIYSVMESEDHPAKPRYVTAGGKTGTAQTGRYHTDGSEVLQGWFAGFFPAEEPQYILVVLAEDSSGSVDASPVFRAIADKITVKQL